MATKSSSSHTQGQAHLCPVMFYGIPDVARSLNLGMTSVWALVRDKELPVVRIGRRTLVPAQALLDFAANLSAWTLPRNASPLLARIDPPRSCSPDVTHPSSARQN